MDEQSGDELRSLRQRAYGPNADIHEDPVALERLRQLEAQTAPRRSQPVEPSEPGPGLPPPTGTLETGGQEFGGKYSGSAATLPFEEAGDDEPSLSTLREEVHADQMGYRPPPVDGLEAPTDDQTPGAPPVEVVPVEPTSSDPIPAPPPAARRRGALIWAGALTGAVLVGAALSYIAVGLAPGNVGVLEADPDAAWPSDFSPREDGSEIFEDFHGLTIVLVPQDWNGGAPSPCLFILSNPTQGLIGGAGCGAGDFDPIAAITVTDQMPDSLLEEFPVGSALQFQLRDGEVVVFAELP